MTPKPVAKAHTLPEIRPEPIDVAIVLSTFGPGIKTLSIKKPIAGKIKIITSIRSNRFLIFFHNERHLSFFTFFCNSLH